MPRSEASVPSRGRRRWRRHRRRPPLRSRRRRLRRRPRRSLSFGGGETPLRLPLAPPRDARLEMFAVEKAPKPSASTPTPPRPVGLPKVVLASFEPAGSGSPRARRAKRRGRRARRTRAQRPPPRTTRDEERGDGEEPRPSPIVPAEPLKALAERLRHLSRRRNPRRVLKRRRRRSCRSRTPTRSRRAPFPPGQTALAGAVSATSGNGFVDAIVSPFTPRTPSFSPRPARGRRIRGGVQVCRDR